MSLFKPKSKSKSKAREEEHLSEHTRSEVTEILRRVRKIELRTRGLVRESLGGEYHSSFKGDGIDFEDFREYQPGDEVRCA